MQSPNMRSFGHGPFHRWLGLEPLARSAAGAEARLALRAEFLQEEGVVQGGILAALADATAVHALMPELRQGERMTSVEFKLNFLAPARLEAGDLRARAVVVKRGRTLAVVRCSVEQAEKPVAEGLFTYIFLRP